MRTERLAALDHADQRIRPDDDDGDGELQKSFMQVRA